MSPRPNENQPASQRIPRSEWTDEMWAAFEDMAEAAPKVLARYGIPIRPSAY